MPERLDELSAVWHARVGRTARAFLLATLAGAVLGGAHLARVGTPLARVATAAIILTALIALVIRSWWEIRNRHDVRRTIGRVLIPTDRDLGFRTLRALGTVARTREDATAGSRHLAELHLERLLRSAPLATVDAAARRRARRWAAAALAALGCACAAVIGGPFRIAEGMNVLAAIRGRAPVAMSWLTAERLHAQAPSYLETPDRTLLLGASSIVPQGTILTVRGIPRRPGRKLVLTDGRTETPFVEDGGGGVVARWTLDQSVVLRVAARFGDILIEEPEPIRLLALEDRKPVVEVVVRTPSGTMRPAPATLSPRDTDRIEIQFAATDDHGLRQVDFVLRAGNHEDRRVLARLDGESTFERGGHVLFTRDAFLRRMYLPVVVTVEARDDDPIHQPKWGKSMPITLLPRPIGEPEAERYHRLLQARDHVVALLDWRLGHGGKPIGHRGGIRLAAESSELERATVKQLRSAVSEQMGALPVPRGLATFILGQAQVLERRTPAGGSALRTTEDVLLAIDKAVRRLGLRDARTVSKRLGEVAEEAANGAKQARESEKRSDGIARLDASLAAVEDGARQLRRLGSLGLDIGSVALANLRRIRRTRVHESLMQTELAARHLAARLRRPNPSFGSAGSPRSSGVESGLLEGGNASGEPSHADERFDQLAAELEQLAREHTDGITWLERQLGEAERRVDLDHLEDEARRRARAVRRAISQLPFPGAAPGSPRASAALAREYGDAMGQALEKLMLHGAAANGRNALDALDDARRKMHGVQDPFDRADAALFRNARDGLARALAWTERALARLRRKATAKAGSALADASNRERKFARRAGNLASRGRITETAFPEEMVDKLERAASAMSEAARALAEREGNKGLELQREAQRLLERANTGKTTDEGEASMPPHGAREIRGHGLRTDGSVPEKDGNERAEDFRRRVLRGLGGARSGKLAPAVHRYAEGLLQ